MQRSDEIPCPNPGPDHPPEWCQVAATRVHESMADVDGAARASIVASRMGGQVGLGSILRPVEEYHKAWVYHMARVIQQAHEEQASL